MPVYRIVFPPDLGQDVVNSPTAEYESEESLRVGDVIELDGKRWQVSSAPIDDSLLGESVDLMVWPAD